ncbi:redoxin domain-containing protein [Oceanobacillus caeni]|uniref:peroxiredoxin family protein n=1 Tax=Bacillaceae TaxID=186817 RepID=UPI000621C0B8|nr:MULTISPECIES: redoxin domain-containing protein [Bacillaceae]KKE78675.1 alkyl hydroperoxide reductase [Bacilli bacterium VT-13-104]PZD83746.1 TlpA family protein disulfide reductase [Bacilli bacterium]MBU8791987.1 redoxin domain-containing protein [Oceanobacillus caeni]MCR1835879.1 redoxin domain-containing protein [Oceanobacillus caeni]PZD84935.1 TlpA family protein disulfide reductase [Bacilli bacterium]
MKKIILVIIIVGMLGWAVYDFVINRDSTEVGTSVGDMAPDIELTTLNGETVKLSDYRGNKVFVNFWATWCPPCRAEMPDIQKFDNDEDVKILAVNLTSTEKSVDDVQKFVDELGLTFPILKDEKGKVEQMYKVNAYPTSYLIDSDGVIRKVALGAMNYEMMVQEFEKIK